MLTAIQTSAWMYPALEVVHLLGIALLLGNLALLECRVLGLGVSLPVADLARLALSISLVGFAIAAGSGLLMFLGQAGELLANRAFTLKMLVLCTAGCNAAWFHARGSLALMDGTARLQMLASGLLWLAALTCGRWIAYV